MGIVSKFKFAGLYIAPNELSSSPDGALVEADNVVIRHKDVIEPRRGQRTRDYFLSGLIPNEVFFYQNEILVHATSPFVDEVTPPLHTLSRDTETLFDAYEDELGSTTDFEPVDDEHLRVKGAEANLNFYFTTHRGVYVLDSPVDRPALPSGVFVPLDPIGVQVKLPLEPGFLANNKRVAYRVLWGKKDFNGTLHLGAPSSRVTVSNLYGSPTPNAVEISFAAPPGATTDFFYQIYRSPIVDHLDAEGDVSVPSDEMQLVQEAFLDGSSSVTVTDIAPEGYPGANLYTNPISEEGLFQSNTPPPRTKDVAYWNDRMWYGNTSQPHRFFLTMIAPPRAGDILRIDGFDFTAISVTDVLWFVPTRRYKTYTDGSVPDNIENTSISLTTAINSWTFAFGDSATGIRAYYPGSATGFPGQLILERTTLDPEPFTVSYDTYNDEIFTMRRVSNEVRIVPESSSITSGREFIFEVGDQIEVTTTNEHPDFPPGVFTVTAVNTPGDVWSTRYNQPGDDAFFVPVEGDYHVKRLTPNTGTSWSPTLTTDTPLPSDNDAAPHRLYYSKLQQPEAVPLPNYIDIGQPKKAILRIIPLRDKLFVFKQEGIYIVSGEEPFRVDLLDDTVRLVAPDSAVAVSNQIYCLTNQGVVAVTEGGVAIVSGPIEPIVVRMFKEGTFPRDGHTNHDDGETDIEHTALARQQFSRQVFGVSHESDRLYSLWFPTSGSGAPDKAFVYSTANGTWTTWTLDRTCGRVSQLDDVLHMGNPNLFSLARERKDYTNLDFADDRFDFGTALFDPAASTITYEDPVDITVGDFIQIQDTLETGIVNGLVTGILATEPDYVVQVEYSGAPAPGILSGTFLVHKAFTSRVKWKTIDAGDPTSTKHFRDLNLHFRAKGDHRLYKVYFATDQITAESTVEMITPDYFVPNFFLEWGPYREPKHERLHVPQEHQRATYLHVTFEVTEAAADWSLNGLSLAAELNSERNRK